MEKKSFEEMMSDLEKIVEDLEQGEVPLEKAMEQYKKGKLLIKDMSKQLEKAKKEVVVDDYAKSEK